MKFEIHNSKVFSSEVGFRCFLKPQDCVEYGNRTREHQPGGGREGNPPPQPPNLILPICGSVRPQRGLPNLPKQSSGKDLPFIIVNFYLKRD